MHLISKWISWLQSLHSWLLSSGQDSQVSSCRGMLCVELRDFSDPELLYQTWKQAGERDPGGSPWGRSFGRYPRLSCGGGLITFPPLGVCCSSLSESTIDSLLQRIGRLGRNLIICTLTSSKIWWLYFSYTQNPSSPLYPSNRLHFWP